MMEKNGYPTEKELGTIQNWSAKDGYDKLMLYVQKLWIWPEYFRFDGKIADLYTGGWSGHEEIIQALQDNSLFWTICWLLSERGGHYKFEIRGA